MKLEKYEDCIRVTSTMSIQAIAGLLNQLEELNLDWNDSSRSSDNTQEIVYALQQRLGKINNAYATLAHDVDSMCQEMIDQEDHNKIH